MWVPQQAQSHHKSGGRPTACLALQVILMGGAEAYRVDGGPAGVGLDRVSNNSHLACRVSYTAANLCVIRVSGNGWPTICRRHPCVQVYPGGDYFDPLGLADDPDTFAELKAIAAPDVSRCILRLADTCSMQLQQGTAESRRQLLCTFSIGSGLQRPPASCECSMAGRLRAAACNDRLLSLFPFEKPLYMRAPCSSPLA